MKVFASAQRRLAFGAFLFVLLTGLWLFWWKKPLGRDNWFIAPRSALWPLDSWLLPLGTLLLCGGFALMCAYDRFRRAKSRREEKTSLRMSLGSLILLAAVLPWTLLGPRKISGIYLVSATWSDISNQYFSTAYRIQDARDFTRNYQLQQQNYDIVKSHVATHPPGAVLFYYGALKIYENVPLVQQLFSTIAPGITAASTPSVTQTIRGQLARSHASDANARPFHDDAVGSAIWCAFLLSLSVGLTVPAVYKLAAGESSTRNAAAAVDDAAVDDAATAISGNDALTKDASAKDALAKVEERARESRGLLGAALFALAPTTVLFAFTLDALMACLIAWSLVLIARRVTSGTTVGICSAIVSGVLIGLASFLSFGALAVWGLLVFAFAIGFGWRSFLTTPQLVLTDISSRRKPAVHRPISDLALILLGFVALWLVLSLIFPMQPREIYARAMEAASRRDIDFAQSRGLGGVELVDIRAFLRLGIDDNGFMRRVDAISQLAREPSLQLERGARLGRCNFALMRDAFAVRQRARRNRTLVVFPAAAALRIRCEHCGNRVLECAQKPPFPVFNRPANAANFDDGRDLGAVNSRLLDDEYQSLQRRSRRRFVARYVALWTFFGSWKRRRATAASPDDQRHQRLEDRAKLRSCAHHEQSANARFGFSFSPRRRFSRHHFAQSPRNVRATFTQFRVVSPRCDHRRRDGKWRTFRIVRRGAKSSTR